MRTVNDKEGDTFCLLTVTLAHQGTCVKSPPYMRFTKLLSPEESSHQVAWPEEFQFGVSETVMGPDDGDARNNNRNS